MSASPGYRRIATEEAWAPKELIDLYRRELAAKTLDDAGFYSLWGFFGGKSERARLLAERIQDLGDRRIADTDSTGIKPVRSGKLRPLAATTAERSAALPNVPAMAESVAGYAVSAVTGFGVPKNTPAQIVDTLNSAVNASLADPEVQSRLAEMRGAALSGSSAAFESIMAAEIENWARVVKVSGATAGTAGPPAR
jgi:hypothetical protein